jgi:hypothetical protein
MHARWKDSATALLLDADEIVGWLRIAPWYDDATSAAPREAWVADYYDHACDPPVVQVLVDPDPRLADDPADREKLITAAAAAIEAGPPELPEPQLEPAARGRSELELLLHAWDDANGRLFTATRLRDEWAHERVYVALTEVLSWTYLLDRVLDEIWKRRLTPGTREAVSQEVDEAIADAIRNNAASLGAKWVEPTTGVFGAYRRRGRDGRPYPSWSLAMGRMKLDLDPDFFRGLKWLRGQLVHRGVIRAVDLRQWRPGAEPRWKWKPANAIPHQTSGYERDNLRAYDAAVAGRDVLGSLSLVNELHEAATLFGRLLGETRS